MWKIIKWLLIGAAIYYGIQLLIGIPILGYKLGVYLGPNYYAKKGWDVDYVNGAYKVIDPKDEIDIAVDWGEVDNPNDVNAYYSVLEDSVRISDEWNVPVKTGYSFDGLWVGGVLYVNRDGYIVRQMNTRSISLVAKWVTVPAADVGGGT